MQIWIVAALGLGYITYVVRWLHMQRGVHPAFGIGFTVCAAMLSLAMTFNLPDNFLSEVPLLILQLFGTLIGPFLVWLGFKIISLRDRAKPGRSQTIKFDCPECGSWLEVDRMYRGINIICGTCQENIEVPNPDYKIRTKLIKPQGNPDSLVVARIFLNILDAQKAQTVLSNHQISSKITSIQLGQVYSQLPQGHEIEVIIFLRDWDRAQKVMNKAGLPF